MTAIDDVAQAQEWFRHFATRHTERDDLYTRMGLIFADDPELASLLLAARPTQRNPPLVFAAIHFLLLSGVRHPLRTHFATCTEQPTTSDPAADLRDFVATHHDAIVELVATRSTQTNSVERSTVLLLLLARLGDEAGPIGLVDVGTSGGGTLLLDRYTHHYTRDVTCPDGASVTTVAGPDALEPALDLVTMVEGPAPLPGRMPTIGWRLGIDQSPIDLDDPAEVRWLLACVWPGDLPRFARLQRAMEAVRADRPDVRRADAVDDLEAVLATVPDGLHPTLTTSWVLNYLPPVRQQEFLTVLDRVATTRDLTLITFESPRRTPGLAVPKGWEDSDETVLGWYRWRDGRRTVQHVATAHAHGRWVRWWADPIVTTD